MNNLIKVIIIAFFSTTSLSAQTATRVIFENNFGNPPTNLSNPTDNAGIRQRWDYMPTDVNTFVFASENAPNIDGNKGYSEAKAIENNYYAVVGPKYIYSSVGLSPSNMQGVYKIWNELEKGDATPGHNGNGGALVINAGTTLSSFSIGVADLKPGRYYKLSYKLFVENGLVKLKQNIISPSGNSKLVSVSSPDNGQNTNVRNWVTQTYWFYLPATCTEDNYAVALENANADNYGNDYAIDDVKFEEFTTAPSEPFSTINCNVSEPIANDDQSLLNTRGSSPTVNVYNNDFLSNQTTRPTQSNATFVPLVPIGGYNTPYTNNQITVKNEGIWTYSSNGDVRFTPANGFSGNPTPLSYRFTDNTTGGSSNIAKIFITYTGNLTAKPDTVNATEGETVTINILENDTDTNGNIIDKSSVSNIYLINPFSLVENTQTIIINGEGTWNIDPSTKNLVFTPEATFKDSPTPIQYYFTDVNSNKSNKELITINVSKAEPQVVCTKGSNTQTPDFDTSIGISTKLTHSSKWPKDIPNGFITLESSDKGFVITRVANTNQITDAKEGMLVYDKNEQCVKLFNGTTWKCIQKSCND